MDQLVSLRG
jgi:hypothetical protein